jgi:hypothetical protein
VKQKKQDLVEQDKEKELNAERGRVYELFEKEAFLKQEKKRFVKQKQEEQVLVKRNRT